MTAWWRCFTVSGRTRLWTSVTWSVQVSSQEPAHQGGSRHPDEIANLYVVDELLVGPPQQWIAVVDDLLTTGGHFKAMQQALSEYFPDVTPILGFFAARRVPNADEVFTKGKINGF